MKKSEIKVGKTYRNKGKGNSARLVLAIMDNYQPTYWGPPFPGSHDATGVEYQQIEGPYAGGTYRLYLSSFARWAGKEVE